MDAHVEVMQFNSILVANRGEIAIRVMRTIAIYSHEDRFSLHRSKADESYLVGRNMGPIEAYLDIEGILDVARAAGAGAIHPGCGFLLENPAFAEACAKAGNHFNRAKAGDDARARQQGRCT